MLKIPFYTFGNYTTIIEKDYIEQDLSSRVDLSDFFSLMNEEFIGKYAEINTLDLGTFIAGNNLSEKVKFGNIEKSLKDVLIAMKLAMPTLRTCDYFLRNVGKGTHGGVDIILPKFTPIPSFTDGVVHKIKERDGIKKDEGNCVVIKSGNQYFSYKHLQEIKVKQGWKVTKGDIVGTCGSTGMSTQFHLHLQVDNDKAKFLPYRSGNLEDVLKFTLDPIPLLRKGIVAKPSTHMTFDDMPKEPEYKQAIQYLYDQNIIHGGDNKIFPDEFFPRWQTALVVYRLASKYNIFKKLKIIKADYTPYTDFETEDRELIQALKDLQKYGIMSGAKGKFNPESNMTGEQWLAILGRLFFDLQDSTKGDWYGSYIKYFQDKQIIKSGWKFIGKAIPRKEVFLILYKTLISK